MLVVRFRNRGPSHTLVVSQRYLVIRMTNAKRLRGVLGDLSCRVPLLSEPKPWPDGKQDILRALLMVVAHRE
jgi:hypothetical protein